ncbi:MAG: hypothetical protein ABSB91_00670 [Sedimentisphaerales bacterium]|jgi:hypothetical protein
MDEGRYGVMIFLLSLAALIISSLPVSLTLLESLEMISEDDRHRIVDALLLWGWLLGLFLAAFSIFKVRRISNLLVKIPVWIFSSLAILFSILWALLVLIALNFHW